MLRTAVQERTSQLMAKGRGFIWVSCDASVPLETYSQLMAKGRGFISVSCDASVALETTSQLVCNSIVEQISSGNQGYL